MNIKGIDNEFREPLLSTDLVLIASTGGLKGLWQAVIIDRLIESDVLLNWPGRIRFVGGSAGAINSVLLKRTLQQGYHARLEPVWREVIIPEFNDRRRASFRFHKVLWRLLFGSPGLIDPSDLFNRINTKLIPSQPHRLQSKLLVLADKVDIAVAAYDLVSNKIRIASSEDPRFELMAMASAAIPVFMRPVEFEGARLTDIGVVDPLLYHTFFSSALASSVDTNNVFSIVAQKKELSQLAVKADLNMFDVTNRVVDSMLDSLIFHQFKLLEMRSNFIVSYDDDISVDAMDDPRSLEAVTYRAGQDAEKLISAISQRKLQLKVS